MGAGSTKPPAGTCTETGAHRGPRPRQGHCPSTGPRAFPLCLRAQGALAEAACACPGRPSAHSPRLLLQSGFLRVSRRPTAEVFLATFCGDRGCCSERGLHGGARECPCPGLGRCPQPWDLPSFPRDCSSRAQSSSCPVRAGDSEVGVTPADTPGLYSKGSFHRPGFNQGHRPPGTPSNGWRSSWLLQ